MKAEDINVKKAPNIQMDVALDNYKDAVLFPKKLLLANESIRKSGHPFSPEKREEKSEIK